MPTPEEIDQDFNILLIIETLGELDKDQLPRPSIYRGTEGEAAALVANRSSTGIHVMIAKCLISPRVKR